ncbi:MAG: hypothetical protein U5K43_01705 [Halofilum sp. (in: g-proteobacteria)]|nr:hypothetical protein [Halofilum sp. (in: g-proteobacteria)]
MAQLDDGVDGARLDAEVGVAQQPRERGDARLDAGLGEALDRGHAHLPTLVGEALLQRLGGLA